MHMCTLCLQSVVGSNPTQGSSSFFSLEKELSWVQRTYLLCLCLSTSQFSHSKVQLSTWFSSQSIIGTVYVCVLVLFEEDVVFSFVNCFAASRGYRIDFHLHGITWHGTVRQGNATLYCEPIFTQDDPLQHAPQTGQFEKETAFERGRWRKYGETV